MPYSEYIHLHDYSDYAGGLLEMALYAIPCLQKCPAASVGMNCMVNGFDWKDNINNFVYT